MSSKLSLIALGLGVYVAFALASFPASIAYRWFAPDALALAGIEGTVWHGSAAYGGVEGLAFSGLRWQLNPVALLTGRVRLSAELRLPDGRASAKLTVSGRRIEIDDLRAATELATLRQWLRLGDTRGKASATLATLTLVDGRPVAADGEIRVESLAIPPLFPTPGVTIVELGNYSAKVSSPDSAGLVGAIRDQDGPLELTGTLSLTADQQYRLDAQIRPRADAPDILVQGIENMSTEKSADGRYHLVLSGSL